MAIQLGDRHVRGHILDRDVVAMHAVGHGEIFTVGAEGEGEDAAGDHAAAELIDLGVPNLDIFACGGNASAIGGDGGAEDHL